MNTRSFFLSGLLAGVAIGFLAHLPVLNFINCILCLWVWVGGFLAVYLYRRYEHFETDLSVGQGAALGAFAGLIGAFIGLFINLLTGFISYPLMQEVAQYLEIEGDFPFQRSGLAGTITTSFFFLLFDAITYPIFGALSGLIAAGIFGKTTQTKN